MQNAIEPNSFSATAADRSIYFISGMWCGTCAKAVEGKIRAVPGVSDAQLNFFTKLLIVTTPGTVDTQRLNSEIDKAVSTLGYTAHLQRGDWISRYSNTLTDERRHVFSDVRSFLTLFLAMWTSMFAFARYSGGFTGTSNEAFFLAVLTASAGAPAVLLGISPYAVAAVRALRSGTLSLDLIVTIGALSALVLSAIALWSGQPEVYLDSAAMIVALLLLTKWFEVSLAAALSRRLTVPLPCADATVEIFRGGQWKPAVPAQAKRGDRIRVRQGQTLSLDGRLISKELQATDELLSGETTIRSFQQGAELRAGMNLLSDGEIEVSASVGERLIDRWAGDALTSVNTKAGTGGWYQRIETHLVLISLLGSSSLGLISWFSGNGSAAALESFLIGVLLFCPCLFVSILPMAQAMSLITLRRRGIFLYNVAALHRLARVANFAFDKTGTLFLYRTEWEVLGNGAAPALEKVLALAKACSSHPILQGLRLTAPSPVRTDEIECEEIVGEGVRIHEKQQQQEILIGRPRLLTAVGIHLSAAVNPEYDTLVALNGQVIGRLLPAQTYALRARAGIARLMKSFPTAKFLVLTGDSNPAEHQRVHQCFSSRMEYYGGLTPEQKADIIRGLENVLYVGDGLNDIAALNEAGVSARVGRSANDLGETDVFLVGHGVEQLPSIISYARYFQRVVRQTILLSFLYNVCAFSLAACGWFSPLTAALAMLGSFMLMILSITRLFSCRDKQDSCA
jgi:P-type E1-E2 ATPase